MLIPTLTKYGLEATFKLFFPFDHHHNIIIQILLKDLMSGVFYHIGYTGAKYPCLVFTLTLTITALLSLGMYNLRVLTDPQGEPSNST